MKIFLGLLALTITVMAGPALAQGTAPSAAPTSIIDVHPLPPLGSAKPNALDPQRATAAYLARVSGPARARSDAYFEGGYWLLFVDSLYALAISALLLWSKFSSRMRNFAQRQTRSRFLQVPIYVAQYFAVTTFLTLPLTIYEGFFR